MKIVEAGLKKAKDLAKHNVKPHFVAQALQNEVNQTMRVNTTMAQKPVNPRNTYLIEWCCEKDSYMMDEWRRAGGSGVRVSLPTWDVSRSADVKKLVEVAKAKMAKGYHVRLHASLPCTMWSSWSRINAAISPAYRVRMTVQRQESRRMLKKLTSAIKELKGPKF